MMAAEDASCESDSTSPGTLLVLSGEVSRTIPPKLYLGPRVYVLGLVYFELIRYLGKYWSLLRPRAPLAQIAGLQTLVLSTQTLKT